MRSSWLLLKVFRRRIGICLFIEFVIVFLLALEDVRPNRPESVLDSFGVGFIIAFALSLLLWFQTRCNTLPFPVSVRQRAWLPMLAFGLLWSMGCLALGLALLCLPIDQYHGVRMLGLTVARVPIYVLGFLFMARLWRARPYLIFLGPFFFMIVDDKLDAPGYQALASTYHLWWPVVLGAIVFYVYEAPIQLAQQDKLLVGGKDLFQATPTLDQHVASHRDFATWTADSLEGAVLLGVVVGYLKEVLPGRIPGSLPELLALPTLLWTLAIGLWLISLIRSQYQCALASGFGPVSAFGVTLMQMTMVLIPLAQTLGVRKGILAQCDQCHRPKFLWATHCPHCGHAGSGTIINKKLAQVVQGKPALPAWRRRLVMRVLVPLQFFIAFGFAGAAGNRPYVTHTVFLRFNENRDLHVDDEVIARIRELVANRPSPGDWQHSNTGIGLSRQPLPEKFRLQVKLLDSGSIWVRGYGLRWDPAETLTGQLAQCLASQLQDVSQVSLEQRQNYGRSPLFQTRGYLDNRIHWVEPRRKGKPGRQAGKDPSI